MLSSLSLGPSRRSWLALIVGAVIAGSSLVASAQPAPIEQHTEAVVLDEFQEDVTTLNASLGGSINTGNTETWQLNTGAAFALVRDRHGLQLNMDFAYGRADVADDGKDTLIDTVRNLKTRARYDFFLTPMDAIFLASGYRWDTFAGLDARVQGQLGYMRNLYKEKDNRTWAELGYDLTYDNYDPDPLPNPDVAGAFLPGHAVVHSVRGFLGYDNKINAALTFLSGLEALVNVEKAKDVRINWDNALRSAISGNFQLEAKFGLQWDNVPVPGAKKLDTLTTLALIYTIK